MKFFKIIWNRFLNLLFENIQSNTKVNTMSDLNVLNDNVIPNQAPILPSLSDGASQIGSGVAAPGSATVIGGPGANVLTASVGTSPAQAAAIVAAQAPAQSAVPRTLQNKISLYKKFKEVLGTDFDDVEDDFIKILDKLV